MSNRPLAYPKARPEMREFYVKFVRVVTERTLVDDPRYIAFCEGVGQLTGEPVEIGGVMTHILDRHEYMAPETWAAIVSLATLIFQEDRDGG